MFDLKSVISVKEAGKVVKIELNVNLSDESIRILNAYIDQVLMDLYEEGVIRKYYNRIDRFIIKPEADWEPIMVKIEIVKLLKLN